MYLSIVKKNILLLDILHALTNLCIIKLMYEHACACVHVYVCLCRYVFVCVFVCMNMSLLNCFANYNLLIVYYYK